MSEKNLSASRIALFTVLLVMGGAFFWWGRNRPSLLLYQANEELKRGNQSSVISEYQRLLRRPDLPREEEIRLRKALGEFYVNAFQNSYGLANYKEQDPDILDKRANPENPYVALAKKEFDRILAIDPNDSSAHYYLGRILWFRGLQAFAKEELKASQKADPKNPEPLFFLSQIELDNGNASAARELALQALAIAPTFDQARVAYINALAALGEHSESIAQFKLLSASYQNDPEALASHAYYLAVENQWSEAESLMKNAIERAPDNGGIRLLRGRLLLLKGAYDQASGEFAQSEALMPHTVWPLVYQSIGFSRRRMCDEAARLSDILVRSYPGMGWSHWLLAHTQLCRMDTRYALSSLDEALRLSPELDEAIHLKAEILMNQERFDEVGTLVRTLLDQKFQTNLAYQLLAQSFCLQGNFAMAQEMAEASIKSNSFNAEAYKWLAMARAGAKDLAGADRAFEDAIRLRSFDNEMQGYQAYVHGQTERLSEMARSNRRSEKLWSLLGAAQLSRKQWSAATEAYLNAVNITPYSLRAQLGLLEAYWENGQKDQADTVLSNALEINSKNKEVLRWRSKIRAQR